MRGTGKGMEGKCMVELGSICEEEEEEERGGDVNAGEKGRRGVRSQ